MFYYCDLGEKNYAESTITDRLYRGYGRLLERAFTYLYSKDNRSQLENEKKTVWENLILSNTTQEKQLNILDVGTGPGFFCGAACSKGTSRYGSGCQC